MATFTEEQQSRIRTHCEVPDSDVYDDALFGPRVATTDVDRWMRDLKESGKPYVLQCVAAMDRILELQVEAAEDASVSRMDKLVLNENAFQTLEQQLGAWRQKLLKALNPFQGRSGGVPGYSNGPNGGWSF